MTAVNVAELRRVLEVPPVEYTVFPLGSNVPYIHKEQSATVIVNRSTLTALLDAYEREREAERGAPDPAEEWTPVPEQVDLTKMPGYQMGYEARQPEIDRLREFALEELEYVKAHWDGTRQYADLLAEARKLGIVEAQPDA